MSSQRGSILVTAETYQALQNRCESLRLRIDEGQRELVPLVGGEKEALGNHPLMDAQRQLDMLEGQLLEAESTLSCATIVPRATGSIVSIGSKVLVRICRRGDDENSEELELFIDGVTDIGRTDIQVITPESPLGAAVVGAKSGDECEFETPSGKVTHVVIIAIMH